MILLSIIIVLIAYFYYLRLRYGVHIERYNGTVCTRRLYKTAFGKYFVYDDPFPFRLIDREVMSVEAIGKSLNKPVTTRGIVNVAPISPKFFKYKQLLKQ